MLVDPHCWMDRPEMDRPKQLVGCSVTHNQAKIPFRASSLPLLARPRIRSPPPSTPPKRVQPVFTPRSTPLTRQRIRTPPPEQAILLTPPPTPIPFSSFYEDLPTPGLTSYSTCSSTPSRGSRLVTSITPTHIRYDDLGLPLHRAEDWWSTTPKPVAIESWSNYGSLEDQQALIRKMALTPKSITRVPWDMQHSPRQIQEVVIDIPRVPARLLHHVSSDGGPIAALKRYIAVSKDEPGLSGMSLFLHCAKKRVPFHSYARVRKERKIVMEWNQMLRNGGKYLSPLIGLM